MGSFSLVMQNTVEIIVEFLIDSLQNEWKGRMRLDNDSKLVMKWCFAN